MVQNTTVDECRTRMRVARKKNSQACATGTMCLGEHGLPLLLCNKTYILHICKNKFGAFHVTFIAIQLFQICTFKSPLEFFPDYSSKSSTGRFFWLCFPMGVGGHRYLANCLQCYVNVPIVPMWKLCMNTHSNTSNAFCLRMICLMLLNFEITVYNLQSSIFSQALNWCKSRFIAKACECL